MIRRRGPLSTINESVLHAISEVAANFVHDEVEAAPLGDAKGHEAAKIINKHHGSEIVYDEKGYKGAGFYRKGAKGAAEHVGKTPQDADAAIRRSRTGAKP